MHRSGLCQNTFKFLAEYIRVCKPRLPGRPMYDKILTLRQAMLHVAVQKPSCDA